MITRLTTLWANPIKSTTIIPLRGFNKTQDKSLNLINRLLSLAYGYSLLLQGGRKAGVAHESITMHNYLSQPIIKHHKNTTSCGCPLFCVMIILSNLRKISAKLRQLWLSRFERIFNLCLIYNIIGLNYINLFLCPFPPVNGSLCARLWRSRG